MIKRISILYIIIFLLPYCVFSQSLGIWDVFDFGAKGDGKTLDTKAIQNAIDDCYKSGGGKVLLHNGCFLSGTICLKSNITLFIESGAILQGSNHSEDYPMLETDYPAVSGEFLHDKSLIYAENANNISILGNGTIDGNGDQLEPMKRPRPHIIVIRRSKNIKIRQIKLYNAAFWVQKYQSCNNLLIDGITVDSRENKDIEKPRFIDVPGGRNTDGCDIVDCKNVRISNCNINSGDDGIVFKSFLKNEGCQNITVTNCLITTNASGIKIGTESAGNFRDFTINNCVMYNIRCAAIGLMTVDGGSIERIIISDITLRNIKGTAIFLRVGNRGKDYLATGNKPSIGHMNDILVQNILGTDIERYGCSITGIKESKLSNIVFENINLTFKKGTDPLLFEGYPDRIVNEVLVDNVPELEKAYPRGEMFGKLPAYGFYVRHVDNINFSGIKLESNEYDNRPAIVADDVEFFTITSLSANIALSVLAPIYFRNVRIINTAQATSSTQTPLYIKIP